MDLILSSGFLAFARHLGAIDAIEQCSIVVDAVVGTSSGALVAALYQAGLTTDDVARLLSERPPLHYMRPHLRPWQGLFTLRALIPLLERYLPRTFEELPKPLAVGVCNRSGQHRLVHRGELVPAILASIAIPHVFPPVMCGGEQLGDGGMVDRTGVEAWRGWRPNHRAIVHLVDRTHGTDVPFARFDTTVVRSPRSRARFWSLGDFAAQRAESRTMIADQLETAAGREIRRR